MDPTLSTVVADAKTILGPWVEAAIAPEDDRLDVVIPSDELVPLVDALRSANWGYLSAVTGLDHGESGDGLEALYHFCNGPMVLTLRVPLPAEDASVPTITGVIPAATIHERELMEMFGIIVQDIPDSKHLLLPEGWPEESYPLRKSFELSATPVNLEPQPVQRSDDGDSTFIIPIGPQHPALKEPGHFEFTVDGETVTHASVRLGYAHRGMEKASESRNWVQNLYLLERVCGICSHIHAMAYCLGVEKLAKVTAPPRAQAIREVVAGLERIHSHLLWFGVAAHEAGFDTLFMYSWRDREAVMDLLEEITGNRVNYSANILGGVKCDINQEQADRIRQALDFLDGRLDHYLNIVTTDAVFLQRTRGIGTMSKEQAESLGTLGPTARASGVIRDIRVEAPYSAYSDFPTKAVIETAGDLEARFIVRLKELIETNKTIRTILDGMPEGELSVRIPRRIKPGETISRVEAPRGELLYFIASNGSDRPERIKVRTPTLCNMASVIVLSVGHQLADVPMILAGVDPCFSCNDRCAMISRPDGSQSRWTWETLRQHGIDYYVNK